MELKDLLMEMVSDRVCELSEGLLSSITSGGMTVQQRNAAKANASNPNSTQNVAARAIVKDKQNREVSRQVTMARKKEDPLGIKAGLDSAKSAAIDAPKNIIKGGANMVGNTVKSLLRTGGPSGA